LDAGFATVNGWISNSKSHAYLTSFLFDDPAEKNMPIPVISTATWTMNLALGGTYEFSYYYFTSTTRTTKAPVTVVTAVGSQGFVFSQQNPPVPATPAVRGGFRVLGTAGFNAGGGVVTVSTQNTELNKKVIADAVRFQCISSCIQGVDCPP